MAESQRACAERVCLNRLSQRFVKIQTKELNLLEIVRWRDVIHF